MAKTRPGHTELSADLPNKLVEQFRALADEEGIPPRQLLRRAIGEYIVRRSEAGLQEQYQLTFGDEEATLTGDQYVQFLVGEPVAYWATGSDS